MRASNNHFFCGPSGAGLSQILGIKKSPVHISSFLWNSRSYYAHKARIAIRYACDLIRLQRGDEVLMPAYNCGSEIDPVIKSGAFVILYNIDRSSIIDIADLQRRITRRTKAIYVTYYFGFPQEISKIKEICDHHGLYLIEDCALSLFGSIGSTKLGASGDIAVFSLTKTLPVPDGGILVVNNSNLLKELWNRRHPNHITVLRGVLPLLKSNILRCLSSTSLTYPTYSLLSYLLNSMRLTSFHANASHTETRPDILPGMYYDPRSNNRNISAITKHILKSFNVNHIKMKRRQNFCLLLSLIDGCSGIEPLFKELPEGVCPLYFPVIVEDRNQIQSQLSKLSIDAKSFWKGYHRGLPWDKFPDACFLKDRVLALPVHQDLNGKEITFIAEALLNIVNYPPHRAK